MADDKSQGAARNFTIWVLSAVFVLALIIAAVVVVVLNQGNGAATPPPGSTPPSSSGVPTAPSSVPSAPATGCTLASETSNDVPQETPKGIEWRPTSYGAQLPYSSTAGPAVESDPIADCYAHTPTGALLALSQIWARAMLNPLAADRAAVIDQQFTDGPGKTSLQNTMKESAQVPWHWRAFRVMSASTLEVTIVGVMRTNDSQTMVGGTYKLRWVLDRWLIDSDSASSAAGFAVSEQQLATYIAWTPR